MRRRIALIVLVALLAAIVTPGIAQAETERAFIEELPVLWAANRDVEAGYPSLNTTQGDLHVGVRACADEDIFIPPNGVKWVLLTKPLERDNLFEAVEFEYDLGWEADRMFFNGEFHHYIPEGECRWVDLDVEVDSNAWAKFRLRMKRIVGFDESGDKHVLVLNRGLFTTPALELFISKGG